MTETPNLSVLATSSQSTD